MLKTKPSITRSSDINKPAVAKQKQETSKATKKSKQANNVK